MRLHNVCFTLAMFLLFLAACRKPTPHKTPPVDLGYLPIDSVCKLYWAFDSGSWWVYENKKVGGSKPGHRDTIDCVSFHYSTPSDSNEWWKLKTEYCFFVHQARNPDDFNHKPIWEHAIAGAYLDDRWHKPLNDHWWITRSRANPMGVEHPYFIYPYYNAVKGGRYIQDTTINGKKYTDVIVIRTNPDSQFPDGIENWSETYWAKNVGIIRYRSLPGFGDLWDFQLVNHYVKPFKPCPSSK
ncbi:MAG: hypothetical protein JNL57_09735 [Bacteroidetes bacterium]|nr:hypothetical protein [Bacteroidota bacterium]